MDTTQGLESDSPEVIREEIERTRLALGQKLETLETEVRSSVHDASESVREKVERIKLAFDLKHQLREHPWIGFSAALGVGYALGARGANSARGKMPEVQQGLPESGHHAATEWLNERAGAEVQRIRALSYGIGVAFLKELLRRSVPPRLAPIAERLMAASPSSQSEATQWPEQEI